MLWVPVLGVFSPIVVRRWFVGLSLANLAGVLSHDQNLDEG